MRIFAQHSIKTITAGRRQYFPPAMFAYRCNLVGVENSAFKKIQAPKELDAMESEKPLGQVREAEIQAPETALLS